ncbi:MAG TPA: outer membrane beta-barrel protein [Thermoanaerobaculia bacterium]
MRRAALLFFSGALVAAAARAQLTSDDVPQGRTIPAKEEVDADMQAARFRLGPIRMIPTISVRDAGYDNNVFGTTENPVSDWSFTIRGGFRFIVPFGAKVYLRASALPEYTWYDKLEERRGWGGLYEATLLGFFNRMTAQLRAYDQETFATYSSEIPTRVLTRTQDASGGFEVELLKRLTFFAKAEGMRVRYDTNGQLPGDPVNLNDRTDTSIRGGPRYYLTPEWSVSAAVEQTWSDFVNDPETRDNQSRAYLLGVQYTRPRLYLNLSGGYRTGDPRDSSTFPAYSTGTGSFFASFFAIRWLELQAYGHRRVQYSLTSDNPYYFENRIGGAINLEVLGRVLLRGYGEAGPNQYPVGQAENGVVTHRRDQITLFGGGASMIVVRPVVLTALVTRTEYNSNIAGQDRTITRFTINLAFTGELVR